MNRPRSNCTTGQTFPVAMELEATRYEVDGKSFTGYLADGSGGRTAPGILVAHEGPGLTGHVKERSRMLADIGYVAFALDLYGEANPPLERAKMFVRELRADLATLRRRTSAALDLLKAHPSVDAHRIAAIGFCFGGTAVLELARGGADVACVVGFHAGLDTTAPCAAGAIKGKVLVCQGDKDPIISAPQRDAFVAEMSAARVDWQMILYGGVGHSFTNRESDAWGFPGFVYDPVADRRSWLAMRSFFDEVLGPVTGGAMPTAALSR